MNLIQTAQARSHAYRLFGRLFQEGITAELHPYVLALPELAAAAPHPFDANKAAAAHHALFHFNLFPYESIFLGSNGLVGGEITQKVTLHYARAGFAAGSNDASPDHISVELAYFAFLTGVEADAAASEDGITAVHYQHLQKQFLPAHLLRWLPPLVQAISAQSFPFFHTLAKLTLDVVADHWLALGQEQTVEWRLPDLPDLLNDKKTGLKQIAHFLATPGYSGIYLNRDDVGRLARQQQIPHGFGGRTQMLSNWLKTAVTYDQFPATLDILRQLISRWDAGYQALAADQPALAPFITPWRQRCRHARHLLTKMNHAAAAFTHRAPPVS